MGSSTLMMCSLRVSLILSIMEDYWLDQKKGDGAAWDAPRVQRLKNAANAYVQLMTPNGKLAALSDTYRQTADTFWLRARIILADTTAFISTGRFAEGRVRAKSVMSFVTWVIRWI